MNCNILFFTTSQITRKSKHQDAGADQNSDALLLSSTAPSGYSRHCELQFEAVVPSTSCLEWMERAAGCSKFDEPAGNHIRLCGQPPRRPARGWHSPLGFERWRHNLFGGGKEDDLDSFSFSRRTLPECGIILTSTAKPRHCALE